MASSMTPDLSNSQISILQALWELKALGTHGATLEQLMNRLSDSLSSDAAEQLEDLERRDLIARRGSSGQAFYSLSALGTACVRQLQDRRLSDLSRNP